MLAGAGIIFVYAKGRREWIPNLSLIVLLLAAVYAVPDISKRWSTYLDESVQISEMNNGTNRGRNHGKIPRLLFLSYQLVKLHLEASKITNPWNH